MSFSLTEANTPSGLASAIAAFNEKSSKTGVVASLNSAGTSVILTNNTGEDILVADTAVVNAGNVDVSCTGRLSASLLSTLSPKVNWSMTALFSAVMARFVDRGSAGPV